MVVVVVVVVVVIVVVVAIVVLVVVVVVVWIHSLACFQERGSREVRARAQAALEDMTPSNLFRCGLTCDYATECLIFLREHFDIEDPDPAMTITAVQAFCGRMKTLFCEGLILGKASSASTQPPASAAPAVPAFHGVPKTVTQIVFEQVDFPEPTLGNKRLLQWK